MGWNLSLILIESSSKIIDEEKFITSLGYNKVSFIKKSSLEKCINPKANTISIGYINNSIIICADFETSLRSIREYHSFYEKELISQYPKNEIITAICNSTVNLHAYSIINNSKKIRYKYVNPENTKVEFGSALPEEQTIYSKSKKKNNHYVWLENNEEYLECQLLEDFTFEVLKRRLGFRIDQNDYVFTEEFHTYKIAEPVSDINKGYIVSIKNSNQRAPFHKRLLKYTLYTIIIILTLNIIIYLLNFLNK